MVLEIGIKNQRNCNCSGRIRKFLMGCVVLMFMKKLEILVVTSYAEGKHELNVCGKRLLDVGYRVGHVVYNSYVCRCVTVSDHYSEYVRIYGLYGLLKAQWGTPRTY